MTGRADLLADRYTRIRPRLVGVAYSVVGTVAEAQDVVSDCRLRLVAADEREPVRDVEAWAVVAVARRAVDVLGRRRRRSGRTAGRARPGRGALTRDGGVRSGAARRPVLGADRVVRFLVGVRRTMPADQRVAPVRVNGGPGFVVVTGAATRFACAVTVHDGLVGRVDIVVTPDKLGTCRSTISDRRTAQGNHARSSRSYRDEIVGTGHGARPVREVEIANSTSPTPDLDLRERALSPSPVRRHYPPEACQ